MKAILIDAVAKEVREVDYDGQLETAYSLLRCEIVDVVRVSDTDVMLVDDEGLLAAESDDSQFILFNNGRTIAGSALVIGDADEEGEATACRYGVEDVLPCVSFATRAELRDKFGIDPQPEFRIWTIDR